MAPPSSTPPAQPPIGDFSLRRSIFLAIIFFQARCEKNPKLRYHLRRANVCAQQEHRQDVRQPTLET